MSTESGQSDPPNAVLASPTIEGAKPSYSVIGRHLSVLRDAASTILAIFAGQGDPGAGEPSTGVPDPSGRRKNPLAARIERHSAAIRRAMGVTARLNPGRLTRWELPQDIRKDLDWQDQVIREILDAEVHFWAATLERDPQAPIDEVERSWLVRIIQMATAVGCSPGNEQHLSRLQAWRASRPPDPGVELAP